MQSVNFLMFWRFPLTVPFSPSFPPQSYGRSPQEVHPVQSESSVLEPNDEQSDAPADLSTYLEPECIIGSTDRQGELMFLVKW